MKTTMPGRLIQNGSSFEYVRLRVPVAVQKVLLGKKIIIPLPAVPDDPAYFAPCLFGTHIKATLRTKNPEYAERRRAAVISYLKGFYLKVLSPPDAISQKDIVALGGEIYQRMIDLNEDNPGSVDKWAIVKGIGRAVNEGRYAFPEELNLLNGPEKDLRMAQAVFGDDLTNGINSLPRGDNRDGMEKRYGPVTDWILQEHSLKVDPETRERLLVHVHEAVTNAAIQLKKNAIGDYSLDPNASRYPKFEPKKEPYTVSMLFAKWQKDAGGKSAKSIANVKAIVESFSETVGDRDLNEIKKPDAVKWRDLLIDKNTKREKGFKSLRTINDSYMVMMRTLFAVAKRDDLRLGENPFDEVRMNVPKSARPKMKRYTDEEICRLLKIAREQTDFARRWLPWLATCMGCRIGELCQLYKESVHINRDGVSYVEIKSDPNGGTLKNELSPRLIPIHPALINEGFLEFIESMKDGPLFYQPGRKTRRNTAAELVTGSMSHWIRKLGFNDPLKAPNHAFRLWWRTAAVSANLQIAATRYLFGHEQGSVESGYIDLSPDQTCPEIAKIVIPVPV